MTYENKHTPAPWKIVTDGISHWIEIEPNKIALIKAKEADRNLISAAPELLEALERSYNILSAFVPASKEKGELFSLINAAISKARGEV